MAAIKKAQTGEKLNPKVSGPYSAKKYLKTKNPNSNFNIKGDKYNLEIDTTGYAGGKKTFRGLETSTKPGKPRPIGVKANRDVVTDAINKGTNKAKNGGPINKAQSGKYVVNWTDKTPAPVTRSPTSGLTPEQKTRIKEWVPGSKISNGKVTPPKAKDGMWMQKAAASIKKRGTEGKCTPITKPGCTGKAKTLAKTFKKIAKSNKKK